MLDQHTRLITSRRELTLGGSSKLRCCLEFSLRYLIVLPANPVRALRRYNVDSVIDLRQSPQSRRGNLPLIHIRFRDRRFQWRIARRWEYDIPSRLVAVHKETGWVRQFESDLEMYAAGNN